MGERLLRVRVGKSDEGRGGYVAVNVEGQWQQSSTSKDGTWTDQWDFKVRDSVNSAATFLVWQENALAGAAPQKSFVKWIGKRILYIVVLSVLAFIVPWILSDWMLSSAYSTIFALFLALIVIPALRSFTSLLGKRKSKGANDKLVGVSVRSLSSLSQGEDLTVDLPILSRDGAKKGTLTVTLTAVDFSGLGPIVSRLEQTEHKLSQEVAALTTQVDELHKVREQLSAEVNTFSAENKKYQHLNEELKATAAKFEEEVKELKGEVTKFAEQNKKLESEVGKFHDENTKLESTRKALDKEVNELKGEVTKFTEQNKKLEGEVGKLHDENTKLESTRKGLEEQVSKFQGEVTKMHDENAKLEDTRKELDGQVHKLDGQVTKMHDENAKLEATRKALDTEVKDLKGEVTKFSEENNKLKETSQELEDSVTQLGNKLNIISTELGNLQKTRQSLEVQVDRQEEQNQQLQSELQKLYSIEEGMKSLAAQQGSDYKMFVDRLTESLSQHKQLVNDFASENKKLNDNRKKVQVSSWLALSNSFSNWDGKVGLSAEEFRSYLDLLGPLFQERLTAKFGGDIEGLFSKLDSDHTGTLNMSELRSLLEQIAAEETAP